MTSASQYMIDWGGKASVHDRLGDKHRDNQTDYNRLEDMVDSRVPDEDMMGRDPE